MTGGSVNLFIAFVAGLLSFFTPCVFPLIPSYILYIGGVSLKDLKISGKRTPIMVNSIIFILGFSAVFICLGAAASLLGKVIFQNRDLIRIAGGSIIILLGLYLMGAYRLPLFYFEKRISIKSRPLGYIGSFILGITFAAGWTPCATPILGSILLLAGAEKTLMVGVMLLISYSLGLALPFFFTALAIDRAFAYFKNISRYLDAISIISGTLLVVIGVLLLLGRFELII